MSLAMKGDRLGEFEELTLLAVSALGRRRPTASPCSSCRKGNAPRGVDGHRLRRARAHGDASASSIRRSARRRRRAAASASACSPSPPSGSARSATCGARARRSGRRRRRDQEPVVSPPRLARLLLRRSFAPRRRRDEIEQDLEHSVRAARRASAAGFYATRRYWSRRPQFPPPAQPRRPHRSRTAPSRSARASPSAVWFDCARRCGPCAACRLFSCWRP